MLAIRKENEDIDLHMVEIMEMIHKSDADTKYAFVCASIILYHSNTRSVKLVAYDRI